MTSKLVKKKVEIKLFCFLNEIEPNPEFEGWPQIVPCNGNWDERNRKKQSKGNENQL